MKRSDRILEVLKQERSNPPVWWYLSFVDEDKFIGGLIIEAHGLASAVMQANMLTLNPGGEVAGTPIPPEELPPVQYRYKLLSLAELNEFWNMEKLKP